MNSNRNSLGENLPPDKFRITAANKARPTKSLVKKKGPPDKQGTIQKEVCANQDKIYQSSVEEKSLDKVEVTPNNGCSTQNNIIQKEIISSMDFDESNFSCSCVDEEFNVVTNKRKRCNDVEIDLSSLKYMNKPQDKPGTQNKFAILGELNIEEEPNMSKNKNGDKESSKISSVNNKLFCPPIFLFNVNIKKLVEELNSKNLVYKIINKSKHKSKLYLKDAVAHSEMMQLLKEKKIESYSYTPKDLKRVSVVLRGLYYKTEVIDIKNELDSLVPNTVDSVTTFSTVYSRKNNIDTGLFLVTLVIGKKVNEITSLRFMLNQRVSWEYPKANFREIQCWNCQQWGHISRNCNRAYACIKCDQNHAPGECQFKQDGDNLPYCVNCGMKGHPSNFKGCTAFKKYIDLKEKIKNVTREGKEKAMNNVLNVINPSSFVSQNSSFADQLRTPNLVNVDKPVFVQDFLKLAISLFDPEPISLEQKITQFMRDYQKLSRAEARKQCVCLMDEIQKVYGP